MKQKTFLITLSICLIALLLATSFSASAYSNDMRSHKDDLEQDTKDIPRDTEWYFKPDNYAELVGWYQELEANYSDYIEIFNANEMYGTDQPTGGYDLYYLRITNESLGFHKPEVMFLGGIHGDETVGTIGMYWFLDWFTRKAFTDEPCDEYSKEWLNWLVDNREIYFIITHNPYGFDHGPQRYDGNGWDLNREGDYDWADEGDVPSIWASENGQTLYRFINNHTFRVGCDIHGGVRMLIYPWASTYHSVSGTSPISGETYEGAPPDFYYFDATGLRLGAYMGDGGGDEPLDETNIGTIDELIWYTVHGGLSPWAYAGDVVANPQEDPYVEDEVFGNYPGAGILWYSPEMSNTKNPSESTFGNDTTDGWGWEIRRFILHQTDIAQPYVRWQSGTIETDITVTTLDPIQLNWQVNGSLVVDHTSIQYGSDPNPIENYDYSTADHNEFEGEYVGGTGWENAYDGETDGIIYAENMTLPPGDYYFVAKAQVDQVYGSVLSPETYGNDPYLRLVKERTNASYYESLTGTDGLEEIIGQTWWCSPVIHVTVINPPAHEIVVSDLEVPAVITHNQGVFVNASISNDGMNNETNILIQFKVDGSIVDTITIPVLNQYETTPVSFSWDPDIGTYNVSIEAIPVAGETSTDNNILLKMVQVISAPDIWIYPNSITFFNNEGVVLSGNLTIGNEDYADDPLFFDCTTTDGSGYDWLSVNISSGQVNPSETINITITADTNGLPIGTYIENVIITSDDPDESEITIPVFLNVVYAHDIKVNAINQPVGAITSGQYNVNASVENIGSYDQTDVVINCSIFEGGIGGTIIDEDFSTDPVDWTITDVGGTAWEWDSIDEHMENSYGSATPNEGYLDSPVLDCSGKSGIALSFWHYWKADYSSGDQDGYVRGSIDGGSTFPFLIDEFHHNNPGEEDAVKYYDISSWADGQAQVMVRFDVWNDNDWYWRMDDFNVSAEITGDLVYYCETSVDMDAYESQFVEFSPAWDAEIGSYGIQVTSLLIGDQNTSNDIIAEVVSVEGPGLAFNPGSFDFGIMGVNQTDSTSFEIWNDGIGLLTYSLSETCSWIDIAPLSGDSTGEHDTITVDINTTGLAPDSSYHCDIMISSNGGMDVFGVDVYVVSSSTEILDVDQPLYDRGFPVRHAIDGDWAAAQDFTPTLGMISSVDLYMRVFGSPEFDLTVELRSGSPDGVLIDSVVFTPGEVPSSWDWLHVDFADEVVDSGMDYFIVIPPAPSGVTTSFGYEWGYAFGNQYDDGSFWFTRDGGGLWRDLPDAYEFAFKTYGY